MALPKFYKVCQDQQGNIVPQVLGSVFNQGTAVLAPLYQDDAGTIPLSNPMTSDATYGSFKFYLNPGHYDLTFTKPGYTFEPIYDLQVVADLLTLGTMATQNANAVAITGGSAVLTAGLTLPDQPGSNIRGIYAGLLAAGGTNRLFIDQVGDAPSVLRGTVQVGSGPAFSTDVINSRVGIGPGVFAPTATLDVDGGVRLRQTLGIGTFPSFGTNAVTLLYNRAAGSGLVIQPTADTGAFALFFLNAAGAAVGSIDTTGSATAFNTSSDVRLKHSIAPLTDSLAVIGALKPVAFRWNADDSVGHGFLAHELQQTIPEAVSGLPDEIGANGEILPQQVDHSRLVVWLVRAIQELAARLDAAGA